jgi:hypothetical protein
VTEAALTHAPTSAAQLLIERLQGCFAQVRCEREREKREKERGEKYTSTVIESSVSLCR